MISAVQMNYGKKREFSIFCEFGKKQEFLLQEKFVKNLDKFPQVIAFVKSFILNKECCL
jgi:hypothetical protein